MTKMQLLKELRRRYLLSLFFPWMKEKLTTNYGLCSASWDIIKVTAPYSGSYVPAEHAKVRDEVIDLLASVGSIAENCDTYWYPSGKIRPRLKLINRAIKYLKSNPEEN